ncbi:MAG: YlxR family protein [Rubrobacteridae bacterium]|nr:YlxR family protein [Rubrobacteridae bacterium]
MKQKQLPRRTCIGCRGVKTKRELIRIVRTPEGSLIIDPSGKANGRGTYICSNIECLETALNSKRLSKALNVEISNEEIVRIKKELISSID